MFVVHAHDTHKREAHARLAKIWYMPGLQLHDALLLEPEVKVGNLQHMHAAEKHMNESRGRTQKAGLWGGAAKEGASR